MSSIEYFNINNTVHINSTVPILPSVLELTNRLNQLFILLIIISIGLIASLVIEIYIDYKLRMFEQKVLEKGVFDKPFSHKKV